MIRLYVERSKSSSGKHMFRSFYIVINRSCNKLDIKPRASRSVKPLYVKGEAFEHEVDVPNEYLAVQLKFVRGLGGRVKGEILVFNSSGSVICRAVYRKLKVRALGCVDKSIINILTCVCSQLKIPVKKYAIIKR
ncbi:MAG: hypothetical protein QXZ63_07755 [Sulfolobales archaeon]